MPKFNFTRAHLPLTPLFSLATLGLLSASAVLVGGAVLVGCSGDDGEGKPNSADSRGEAGAGSTGDSAGTGGDSGGGDSSGTGGAANVPLTEVDLAITGRITDGSFDGWSGIEGAKVVLEGADVEVQADATGFFSFDGTAEVPVMDDSTSGDYDPFVDTLVITKDGYLPREYPISSYEGLYSFISLGTETQNDSAMEVWEDVDFRADPINVTIHDEWEDENNHYKLVTFHIAEWKGEDSRMGAYYAYPKDATGPVPGIAQTHGGGGRARLSYVRNWANRGYAAVAISWNALDLTEQPNAADGPYTDWGAINPTQYDSSVSSFSIDASADSIDDVVSARNIRWYPLTYAFCRAITFLESQDEVDADKIGAHGYSMGGNITTFALGIDDRIKVGAPQNGGEGFHYFDFYGGLFPATRGLATDTTPRGLLRGMINEWIEPHQYIQSTTAKVLFQGATNDHHARISKVSASWDLLRPEQEKHYRWAHAARLDHKYSADVTNSLYMWMDAELMKTGTYYPQTPASYLQVGASGEAPTFVVTPDPGQEIVDVDIDYSYSPDDDEREWTDAESAESEPGTWTASIPFPDTYEANVLNDEGEVTGVEELPVELFVAMAHITYKDSVTGEALVVSTDLAQVTRDMMDKAGAD